MLCWDMLRYEPQPVLETVLLKLGDPFLFLKSSAKLLRLTYVNETHLTHNNRSRALGGVW